MQYLKSETMKTNSPVKLLKGQIFPIFMGMFLMFSLSSFAQTAKKEVVEIKIKTSAVCNMCKESIEKGLIYEKGIKDVTLDVDSKIATVKYRSDKTTPEERVFYLRKSYFTRKGLSPELFFYLPKGWFG